MCDSFRKLFGAEREYFDVVRAHGQKHPTPDCSDVGEVYRRRVEKASLHAFCSDKMDMEPSYSENGTSMKVRGECLSILFPHHRLPLARVMDYSMVYRADSMAWFDCSAVNLMERYNRAFNQPLLNDSCV